jgi:apolipoprotein N-acyltransferase
MSRAIVAEALWRVTWWALATRFRRPPARRASEAGLTPAGDAVAGGEVRADATTPAATAGAPAAPPQPAPPPAAETAPTASTANR